MDFNAFKQKYEHKKVEEQPNQVPAQPVVSVCVMTYQHKPYIKQCLDGILMQETDFPFEILLGEDASTDGTREICLEYAKKHPDKIRLFLHHRENNIKIGGNPTGRFNFLYNLYTAQGKYIALCEGDDYWIDPLKLQKQVEFLKGNEECSIVFHACKRVNRGKSKIVRYKGRKKLSLETYLCQNPFVTTGSIIFKKEVVMHYDFWMVNLFAADFVFRYLAFLEGDMGYIDDVMSVYNKGVEGSWSMRRKSKELALSEYNDNLTMLDYIVLKHDESLKEGFKQKKDKLKIRLYKESAYTKNYIFGFFFMLKNINIVGVKAIAAYLYRRSFR